MSAVLAQFCLLKFEPEPKAHTNSIINPTRGKNAATFQMIYMVIILFVNFIKVFYLSAHILSLKFFKDMKKSILIGLPRLMSGGFAEDISITLQYLSLTFIGGL
jgi:hypothetical protein